MKQVSVQILPGFFLTVAAAILLIPIPWLFAWLVAAVVHEVFHLLAVLSFRYPVLSVTVGAGGAKIKTHMPPDWKMAVCALAGPAGGFLLLLLLRYAPRLAICGLIQSLYNLLPLCHLDGGNALCGLLSTFLSPLQAERICIILERILIFFLVIAALYGFIVLKIGIIPLLFVAVLLLKNKKSLANSIP